MKVVLIGGEPLDYSLAFAEGVARSCETVMFAPTRGYAALAGGADPALDLRLMDWPRHRSLSNPAFLLRLVRAVRAERPDVVHVLSNTQLWLAAALRAFGAPVVTTVHDVARHPGDRDTATLPGWAPVLTARLSDALVVHGEGLRRAAMRRFGKPAPRVHVLSHPALARYAALPVAAAPDPDRFTVLMFGRIFAYKGLDTLVRAEARLAGLVPHLRLVIAGRGDDPMALAPEMGSPGRYDIRNRFIPDAEVAALFRAADLVVLPYAEASQSGVLNVAAPFGKPVVVTDVGELGATVRAAGLGLVVPPGDPVALAEAILGLSRDPDRRAAMGQRARAWAEGPNSAEAVGREARRMYERMLRKDEALRPNDESLDPVAGLNGAAPRRRLR